MNNTKEHQSLVNQILLECGSLPYLRLWPRRVGLAIPIYTDRPVYFGVKDEADIQGIMAPYGRCVAIEVKTGAGKLRPGQIRWKVMFIKFGGLYIEGRSIDSVKQLLQSNYRG